MRILITGAASGIGRATCLRLARDAAARGAKARIAVVDLASAPGLEAVADDLDGGITGNLLGRLPGISQITRS